MLYVFAQSIVPAGNWNISQRELPPSDAAQRISDAQQAGLLCLQIYYPTTAEAIECLLAAHNATWDGRPFRVRGVTKGQRISVTPESGDSFLLIRLTAESSGDIKFDEIPDWKTDLHYTLQEFSQVTGEVGRPKGTHPKTQARIERAKTLAADNWSVQEISQEMDVSVSSVRSWLRQ